MATWDDVSRVALALPGVEELTDSNGLKWQVRRKHFAWERPLRKRDIAELGADAPEGDILGVFVADLIDKRGLIGSNPDVFFTVPHYKVYPAVLVLVEKISLGQLQEVVTDSWLVRAPKTLVKQFLSRHPELGGE